RSVIPRAEVVAGAARSAKKSDNWTVWKERLGLGVYAEGFVRRADVAEVTGALRVRRDSLVVSDWGFLVAEFLRDKEESLLFARVVVIRNKQWAAQRGTKIIAPVKRSPSGLVEKIPCIEHFVANEFVGAATKIGGT